MTSKGLHPCCEVLYKDTNLSTLVLSRCVFPRARRMVVRYDAMAKVSALMHSKRYSTESYLCWLPGATPV